MNLDNRSPMAIIGVGSTSVAPQNLPVICCSCSYELSLTADQGLQCILPDDSYLHHPAGHDLESCAEVTILLELFSLHNDEAMLALTAGNEQQAARCSCKRREACMTKGCWTIWSKLQLVIAKWCMLLRV